MNVVTQQEAAVVAFEPSVLFSKRVQKWLPPSIRGLLPLEALPGMISLLAGKPNPKTFPISNISISVKGSENNIELSPSDLEDALQYGLPGGAPELVEWFKLLQIQVHGLSDDGSWGIALGSGSQDLLFKAFQIFTDPGDSILVETPAYSGTLGFLKADGFQLIETLTDEHGLIPGALEKTLVEWPSDRRRPSVLYTIPTGSNPAGCSIPQARKIEILRLAKRFNFLIFEDDAYWFIDFADPSTKARSYIGLEPEVNGETGRVIRFDSMSKIVSSGMRLGVMTAASSVIQKINLITANTNLQPSSTSQLIALALLRTWGHTGFLAHCEEVASFYRSQRDMFITAAERHLSGKATWNVPTAGMFLWITLHLPAGMDSFDLVSKVGVATGVLAVPGAAFMPNDTKTCQVRGSFSLISEADANEACRRLAHLVDMAEKRSLDAAPRST